MDSGEQFFRYECDGFDYFEDILSWAPDWETAAKRCIDMAKGGTRPMCKIYDVRVHHHIPVGRVSWCQREGITVKDYRGKV